MLVLMAMMVIVGMHVLVRYGPVDVYVRVGMLFSK